MTEKKILYVSKNDSALSQIAAAYTQLYGGSRLEVESCGWEDSKELDPDMIESMHEKGVDMGYRIPDTFDDKLKNYTPDIVIYMDSKQGNPVINNAVEIQWNVNESDAGSLEDMKKIRDDIEVRVKDLIEEIK